MGSGRHGRALRRRDIRSSRIVGQTGVRRHHKLFSMRSSMDRAVVFLMYYSFALVGVLDDTLLMKWGR